MLLFFSLSCSKFFSLSCSKCRCIDGNYLNKIYIFSWKFLWVLRKQMRYKTDAVNPVYTLSQIHLAPTVSWGINHLFNWKSQLSPSYPHLLTPPAVSTFLWVSSDLLWPIARVSLQLRKRNIQTFRGVLYMRSALTQTNFKYHNGFWVRVGDKLGPVVPKTLIVVISQVSKCYVYWSLQKLYIGSEAQVFMAGSFQVKASETVLLQAHTPRQ